MESSKRIRRNSGDCSLEKLANLIGRLFYDFNPIDNYIKLMLKSAKINTEYTPKKKDSV